MPNKKKQRNSFYFFMKDLQEKLRQDGRCYNMSQMPEIARSKWQEMSLSERRKYEVQALTNKMEYALHERCACDGTPIRVIEENRARESESLRQMRQGIVDFVNRQRTLDAEFIETNAVKKLYFTAFNVLCRVKETNTFIPNEIGLVEYTIKDGICKEYHNFINPGEIPRGYTGEAIRHSESTHGISIFGHEGSEGDYYKIWQDIMDFISPSGNDVPPLFCAAADIPQNLGSLKWLAQMADADQDFEDMKIWDSAYLHMELRAGAGSPAVSYSLAEEELKNTAFDYTPGLMCEFHDAKDNLHCALRKVKSLCCVVSDVMCKLFNVSATVKHLPERAQSVKPYEVFRPSTQKACEATERGAGRGKPRVPGSKSKPGSAVGDGVCPQLPARSELGTDSETEQSERTTPTPTEYSNLSGESDDESEKVSTDSSPENHNPQRMPPVAAGTSPVVRLRQPVSTSIALNLARSRAAPAVAPGKGIGRGQRKE